MVIAVLFAVGMLLWPPVPDRRLPVRPGRRRGVVVPRPAAVGEGRRRLRPAAVPVGSIRVPAAAGTAAVVVGVLAGPVAGAALAMAVLTGSRLARQSSLARRRRVVLTELSAAMRALVREIRAGASVAQACARVAATAGPATGGVWESLAGELGFGIASPDMAPRPGDGGPADELAVVTDRLRAALRLSARRGVPPVDLVAACAADVEATAAMLDRQAAEVAGPRLSGYLLAALPVLGLLLGTGMGADPVAVLVSTGLGQVLLVVGVGLSCAGLRWIARIVR